MRASVRRVRIARGLAISIAVALSSSMAASSMAAPAAAQPARPAWFYIVAHRVPELDPVRLPAEAREPARRIVEIERTLRASRTDPTRDVELLQQLDAELEEAWERARIVLDHAALDGSLEPEGWLALGEARFARASYAAERALDAGEADPRAASDPHLRCHDAIAAWRRAAAGDAGTAAWARYREATCRLGSGELHDARSALQIVAASGTDLAPEARFLLGELAFDENDHATAAAWYARARSGIADERRALVIYKLAWARWLAGRRDDARAAIALLPPDAPPDLRAELAELRDAR